eukprot:7495151-Lingulodinium_polyedra.AAC.1
MESSAVAAACGQVSASAGSRLFRRDPGLTALFEGWPIQKGAFSVPRVWAPGQDTRVRCKEGGVFAKSA